MALIKKVGPIASEKQNQQEIVRLSILEANDRNTIYNLLFAGGTPEREDEDKRK